MGRYVEVLILLLPVISGPDWIDPYAVPAPFGNPHDVDIGTLRVGLYEYDGLARVSANTVEAVARARGVRPGRRPGDERYAARPNESYEYFSDFGGG
jgi:Asp-tRNA(Asn)/Glu-tRNA(Gln) amidotransferase A subunit family amidase